MLTPIPVLVQFTPARILLYTGANHQRVLDFVPDSMLNEDGTIQHGPDSAGVGTWFLKQNQTVTTVSRDSITSVVKYSGTDPSTHLRETLDTWCYNDVLTILAGAPCPDCEYVLRHCRCPKD